MNNGDLIFFYIQTVLHRASTFDNASNQCYKIDNRKFHHGFSYKVRASRMLDFAGRRSETASPCHLCARFPLPHSDKRRACSYFRNTSTDFSYAFRVWIQTCRSEIINCEEYHLDTALSLQKTLLMQRIRRGYCAPILNVRNFLTARTISRRMKQCGER